MSPPNELFLFIEEDLEEIESLPEVPEVNFEVNFVIGEEDPD
jgi:hypothetical protein